MTEFLEFTKKLSKSTRKLENPFPFFAEATDAASKFYAAQRDYLMVSAELRAQREARRAAFMVGALVFLGVTTTLTLFWVTMQLHETGWPAWVIALSSLVVFGGVTGLLFRWGLQAGKSPKGNLTESPSLGSFKKAG